ncbi:MAG: leucine zipper domain-containing protein [Solirubrobacteraceae bacterium]
MPHHRASHTPLGRSIVVRRVVEERETFAQAAACSGVSTSTLWAWVQRWNAATPEERASLACLEDRSSRPRRSPSQVPAEEAARICLLRERTGWSPRRLADEPGSPGPTPPSIDVARVL